MGFIDDQQHTVRALFAGIQMIDERQSQLALVHVPIGKAQFEEYLLQQLLARAEVRV